jgi:hypothetical protein
MELLCVTLIAVYLLSLVGMSLCTRHVLQVLQQAFEASTCASVFALWREAYADDWWSSTRLRDLRTDGALIVTPVVNTAMLAAFLLAIATEALRGMTLKGIVGTEADFQRLQNQTGASHGRRWQHASAP